MKDDDRVNAKANQIYDRLMRVHADDPGRVYSHAAKRINDVTTRFAKEVWESVLDFAEQELDADDEDAYLYGYSYP